MALFPNLHVFGLVLLSLFYCQVTSDGEPPRISCPADLTQDTDFRQRTATVNVTLNRTDNVGVDRISCMDENGTDIMWTNGTNESTISYGNHTITCEASDAAGLTANCTFQASITDNEDPRISCPGNRTVGTEPGEPTRDIYIAVSSVDNADANPELNCRKSYGRLIEVGMNNTFGLGLTSISCKTTDMDGNSNGCSFMIEIVDDEDPVGECPGDIKVGTTEGLNSSTVMFSINVTDNVDPMSSIACNYQSGDVFYVGNTIVMCIFTDSSNRTSSCMFNVTIEDNEAPRIACPDDITRPAETQILSTAVIITVNSTDNVAVASTNCDDGKYEITNGENRFFYGNNNIFCEATDSAGLRNNCSFLVNITDEDPPIMHCAGPPSLFTDSNSSTVDIFILVIVIEIIQPQTPDLQCIDSNGNIIENNMINTFDVGSTSITCLAADAVGNAAECLFSVEVIDDDPPVFQCPDVALNSSQGLNSTIVVFPITVTDNVDPSPVVSCNYDSGSSFEVGLSNVICTISDASDNVASCMFSVIIEDNQPPVLECPDGIVQSNDRNMASTSVTLKVNSTDNVNVNYTICSIAGERVRLDVTEQIFHYGSNPVFCESADSSGLTSTCTFLVNITDEDPPLLTCPTMPLETYTDQGRNTGNATIRVVVTDVIDRSPSVSCADPDGRNVLVTANPVQHLPPLQDVFVFGLSNVTCTASDMDGNSAECLIQVQVLDNEAPIFQCPDVTLNTTQGLNSTIVKFPIIVTDNVDSMPTIDCNRQSGDTFYFGNTTVQCGISDASGNADNCSFNVRIIDNQSPVLECPNGIVQRNDRNMTTTSVALKVNSTDNVNVNYTICSNVGGRVRLDVRDQIFYYGSNPVFCESADSSGLTSTCNFLVNITDEDPPLLTCPTMPLETYTDQGRNTGNATIRVVVTDVIDRSPSVSCADPDGRNVLVTVNRVLHLPPLQDVFVFGLSNVTCTASDMDGNSAECLIQVQVLDNEAPIFQCPDVTLNTTQGLNSTIVEFPIIVTDNVDSMPTIDCNRRSGDTFYFGNTTVQCGISDASENADNCSFNVRIIDQEKPVPNCPESGLTVPTAAGSNSTTVSLPDVTDNVDTNPTTLCTFPVGNVFQLGMHNVMCTFEDASGNIESCAFTVTVVDRERPTPSCPASLRAHQIPSGLSSVVVTYSVSATDNVDSSPNIACSPASGSAFSVGETIIVCVFTDQASNNDTCAFAVHVEDIQEPSITCPASMTLETANGTNSETTTFSATATDLVDASPNVVCLPASGTSFVLGDTTVTCTATDASGNIDECSFNVRIEDRERPILRCAAPQITANIGATVARVRLDITAEDNVDPSPTVTCSPPSGEFQEANLATDYVCVATDTAGNIASCNLQVTVQEPTVACFNPYESWYGECLLTSVLTTSLGILQINGVGVSASPDFVEMVGAEYLAFRRDLLETIINIVGLPRNRLRLEIISIQTGSIDVELNVAIAGRTEEEVTANTATFMDSSFTSQRDVNELSAGLDTYTMSFFQARAPTTCSDYCQNGGICRESRGGMEFCRCPDGFSGERCENTVTEEEEGAGSGTVSEAAIIGIIVGVFLTLLLLFIFLAICLLLLWRQRLASQRLKWVPSDPTPPMEAYLNQHFSIPYIAQGGPGVGHTHTSRRGPKLMID